MPHAINPLVVPTYHRDDSDHNVDRSFEIRRLRRNLITLLDASPVADFVCDDDAVSRLLPAYFLSSGEAIAVRAVIKQQRVTIVAVLDSIWKNASARLQILALKHAQGVEGRRVVIALEHAVARQPRLLTARAVASALGAQVTADDRMAVLAHLLDQGGSTLHDCACKVGGASPYSTILALAAEGAIAIDLNRRLLPSTRVDLPSRLAA